MRRSSASVKVGDFLGGTALLLLHFPERFPCYLYRRARKKIVTNSLVILKKILAAD
jgi:hypothetical protein